MRRRGVLHIGLYRAVGRYRRHILSMFTGIWRGRINRAVSKKVAAAEACHCRRKVCFKSWATATTVAIKGRLLRAAQAVSAEDWLGFASKAEQLVNDCVALSEFAVSMVETAVLFQSYQLHKAQTEARKSRSRLAGLLAMLARRLQRGLLALALREWVVSGELAIIEAARRSATGLAEKAKAGRMRVLKAWSEACRDLMITPWVRRWVEHTRNTKSLRRSIGSICRRRDARLLMRSFSGIVDAIERRPRAPLVVV